MFAKGGVHTRTRKGKQRTQKKMVNMKTQDMMYYVGARQTEKKVPSHSHTLQPTPSPLVRVCSLSLRVVAFPS